MAYCGPRGIELDAFLRWSQRSQDAALEWAAREARRCSGCGSDPDEWADDQHAYHAHIGRECPGCAAVERLQKQIESKNVPLRPGQRVVLPQIPAAACPQCNPRAKTPS